MKSKIIKRGLCLLAFTTVFSCNKLVEVPAPVTELTSSNVFAENSTAAAVLTGVYAELSGNGSAIATGSIAELSLGAGLSADELSLYGGGSNTTDLPLLASYLDEWTAGLPHDDLTYDSNSASYWSIFYQELYVVNKALEQLNISNSLTPAVKQQLTGEAKFLRAFFYFYLVNLYGDVPLTTSSDYKGNAVLARSSTKLVYQQIVADLVSAQSLLSNGYVAADAETGTTERVRPNKWVATALLARAYLYTGDWADAIKQSTAIISNSSVYSLAALNSVFLKNSSEAIWQLQPVNVGWNTWDALVFVLPPSGPSPGSFIGTHPVYLSPELESSFEPGDQRNIDWIGNVTVSGTTYYYPYKYKSATINAPVTEYTMVLRLGEQYLIRAEAEAENGDTGDAITDLNTIRNRAGLPAYAGATDKTSLLAAILHERQVELFAEWGHRWLDLKRTGNIDAVMTVVAPTKGTTWNPDWALYPLPLYDITQDPKLTQNPGY